MTDENNRWKNVDPLISVVLVNYNGKRWIDKCLSSLKSQTFKNFEIIFVDNGSTDNSLEYLTDNYNLDNLKIVKSPTNTGFATGNNLGIDNSNGEIILLMNNDAWVDQSFIAELYAFYNNSKLDVVAPIEVDYDSNINRTQGNEYQSTLDVFGHCYFIQNPSEKDKNKLLFLSGACIMFSKKLYEDTGGLDNDFFMYFEDTDWFWRLNLYDKKFNFARDILFHHYYSGTTTSAERIKYRSFLWRNQNTLQMLLKNYSFLYLLIILPIYLLINIGEMIFFFILLKPKISLTYIQGIWFNIVHLKRTIKKRSIIQGKRVIPDSEIVKRMYIGSGKLHHLLMYFRNHDK